MIGRGALAALLIMAGQGAALAADCEPAPEPVYSLAYGSRYSDAGSGSSTLDESASEDVDEALGPIDDFLRSLTAKANEVFADDVDRRAIADCVIGQMATWAQADAMGDLVSRTANLTIGSRLSAFGMAALQVAPYSTRARELKQVKDWLNRRQRAQMTFWETAPNGAAQGNLRAWSALGANTIGELTNDAVMLGWSAWSATYILCTAAPDGSLPQEMSRGRFALHYQLHAIAPLSVTAALLHRQGMPIADQCDGALKRVVEFAARDLENGAQSQAITGEIQTFFDGSDEIEGFNLAWIESYLTLYRDPALEARAAPFRPLSHSKLGGDQTAIWTK
ncbi:alginate lyase family protein [Oceaniglobus ichthyenteri]|uniref:alginate lyase family protein n=1 Tax=Oceaniglobus ichthyenteri TaxID=2136177 RepID=UPI0013DDEA35|nr:alginate lyase family protein [Oceaniglobus ichthyenteri]